MKIIILGALGAQGGYLELARPATVLLYRAESTKLYESFGFPARFPARGWSQIPGSSIFCYVPDFHYE